MGIVLIRVDERLIHGQVVIAWGNHLRSKRFVVFDDEVADSEWEQDLYRLALPESAEARFHSIAEAGEALAGLRDDPVPTVVLLRSLGSAEAMARDAWGAGDALNLGGLHHKAGSREVRSYLHLDAEDLKIIRALQGAGVEVYGQDLPSSSVVEAEELLGDA